MGNIIHGKLIHSCNTEERDLESELNHQQWISNRLYEQLIAKTQELKESNDKIRVLTAAIGHIKKITLWDVQNHEPDKPNITHIS